MKSKRMSKVSKEEFYSIVGNMNVVVKVDITKGYPYNVDFVKRDGCVVGRCLHTDRYVNGVGVNEYYILESLLDT